MFTKLNKKQLQNKINFIKNYQKSINPATASIVDANANVENKNIATLESELNKDINIQINREIIYDELKCMYNKQVANKYLQMIDKHLIYVNDESSLKPYCVALSMYPFMLNGLKDLGGESEAPKHIDSFCGSFVNLIFAVSSQFAGAVAAVEMLTNFDYFARKDYGEDYLKTHTKKIENHLQHIIYALNQPAAARGFQAVFFNISIFDKYYFNAIFEHYVYPDGSKPKWESIDKLQKFFMKWFNKERKKAILTFPVVTFAGLSDGNELKDKDYEDFISNELAEGNAFFLYIDENASSLSSCCRLRNDITDQLNEFSYTLGAGGVMTGSLNVITMNLNRIVQEAKRKNKDVFKYILYITKYIHKFQSAFRNYFRKLKINKMLPVYDANFIEMDKQFLTVGINGLVESAEFLGYEISNNKEYKQYVKNVLKTISDENKKARKKYGFKFNTELIPAENLGVKNALWDEKDGYFSPRECYNSYIYLPEDDEISIIDKIILHGKEFMQYLDGGSALHLNLENYLTKEGFKKLLNILVKEGCNYTCFNIKITICNKCNNIDKKTLTKCPKCGSNDVDYATRVIGYLKRVSSFSNARQKEEDLRYYNKNHI